MINYTWQTTSKASVFHSLYKDWKIVVVGYGACEYDAADNAMCLLMDKCEVSEEDNSRMEEDMRWFCGEGHPVYVALTYERL